MNPASKFEKYLLGVLIIVLTFLLAASQYSLSNESPLNLRRIDPETKGVSSSVPGTTKLTCTSWNSVNINGCTWEMFSANPQNPKCITNNKLVTLNLASTGATSFKWKEVPSDVYCSNASVVSSFSTITATPISATKQITIPSSTEGNKKICVQFQGTNVLPSDVCGGVITYRPPTSNKLTCKSFENVNINGCSWAEYSANPRSPKCTTDKRTVTLNLNSPGATSFKWKEVPNNVYCTAPTVVSAFAGLQPAGVSTVSIASATGTMATTVTIPSVTEETKKICVQFSAPNILSSDICGSTVTYSTALQPSKVTACTGAPKGATDINAITINHGRHGEAPEPARNTSIAKFAQARGLDIVLLQEIAIKTTGDQPYNDPEQIKSAFYQLQNKPWYSHYQMHPGGDGINGYGNMLVTKFPILETERRYLPTVKAHNDRYFIRYKLQTPYGPLQVYNIHTRYDENCYGTNEAIRFVKETSSTTDKVLIMGDHNIPYPRLVKDDDQWGACNENDERYKITDTTASFPTWSCIPGSPSCDVSSSPWDLAYRPKTSPYTFTELCIINKANTSYNGWTISQDHNPIMVTIRM